MRTESVGQCRVLAWNAQGLVLHLHEGKTKQQLQDIETKRENLLEHAGAEMGRLLSISRIEGYRCVEENVRLGMEACLEWLRWQSEKDDVARSFLLLLPNPS